MAEWLIYSEPMHRANPKLTAGDIELAIARYTEATGKTPRFMGLNPKNAGLSIPEGIELRIIGGFMGFEVWLADSDPQPVTSGILTPLLATTSRAGDVPSQR